MRSISVLASRIFYFLKPVGLSVGPFGECGGRVRGGCQQVRGWEPWQREGAGRAANSLLLPREMDHGA